MPSEKNKRPRRRVEKERRPAKPAKSGTPVRNALLLAIFAAAVALLVILLPKEPTSPVAAMLAPGQTAGPDVEVEELPLRISEVMASNQAAYPDDKGNYPDWIEIENTGDQPVNMEGVGLSDRNDRVLFIFPAIVLGGRERIVVFCDDTNVSNKDAAPHARFKISSLGETIYLFDRGAVIFDEVQVPALNSDVSYALTDTGWMITEMYTPGFANTEAGYEAFRSQAVGSAEGLVLNEVLASNVTTIPDEDGEFPDWIELYNGGPAAIDLSMYALSDDESNPVKWRFPQGAVIQPGEYYVVYASGKDRPGGGSLRPHTNFKLAAEGETVILSDILRQVIDRVTYDNLAKDASYGRIIGLQNEWQVYSQPTPGYPNDYTGAVELDRQIRARNTSGVFISEVVTSSTGLDTPYGLTSYDWIELVNLGNTTADLSNWGLSDSVGRPRKWQFKEGTTLGPGEYLLVFPSGLTASPTNSGAVHADFRLSALGEAIVLSDAKGNIYDKLVVPKLERDNSYGRNFDQGGLFYYETPTAAAANTATGFIGYTDKPIISVAGGLFTQPVTTTISAPEGVKIRYTLDGSNPTETQGYDYVGPIELTSATPLRARGFKSGYKPSDIATETYLVNVYHTLPVIALTVDPLDLDNPLTGKGMLAEDESLYPGYVKVPFDTQPYWEKLAYDGNFEYFLPDGKQMLNQGIEIQLNGQYSMDQPQKSFRITARARYGKSTLAYPFFEDRPYSEYQAVILRNGGQDGKYTRIIDALQSKIIDWTGADIMHMASRPVIVFLNGKYWGHYNLRDRINKYSIAAYEGISNPDNIDFIKGNSDVISGNYDDYGKLMDFVKENDLNDPQALQTVLDWVDVDNLFDFYIFQIYFGNSDAGNIKFYRERVEGAKWRWVLFDLDWGYFMSERQSVRLWLKEEGAGDKKMNNRLIRSLLSVPHMRDKFLARFGQLCQEYLFDTERIRAQADLMIAQIQPELGYHFNRWAGLAHPLVSEEPGTAEALYRYWETRVTRMHNVLKKRPNLLWDMVKEWFELTDEQMTAYFGPQPEMPADAI